MSGTFVDFVQAFTRVIDDGPDETDALASGGALLQALVSDDAWLPDEYAVANEERYQQFLLHLDPGQRFSVVSFVWLPGQRTPVHDHCTWGLVGVLRGEEWSQKYGFAGADDGTRAFGAVEDPVVAGPGSVDAVSPAIGDIHVVANNSTKVAISIHVYGGNIGRIRRHTYDEVGETREFISGYVSTPYARLWA